MASTKPGSVSQPIEGQEGEGQKLSAFQVTVNLTADTALDIAIDDHEIRHIDGKQGSPLCQASANEQAPKTPRSGRGASARRTSYAPGMWA